MADSRWLIADGRWLIADGRSADSAISQKLSAIC